MSDGLFFVFTAQSSELPWLMLRSNPRFLANYVFSVVRQIAVWCNTMPDPFQTLATMTLHSEIFPFLVKDDLAGYFGCFAV